MGFAQHGRRGLLTRVLVSRPVLRVSCWVTDGLAQGLLNANKDLRARALAAAVGER